MTTSQIAEILAEVQPLSDVTSWLATSSTAPAAETRAFLDRALRHLPGSALRRTRIRLQSCDAKGVDAAIHELVAFEVCRGLGMNPALEPEAGNLRPDLSLQINGETVWADVFVTYRPIRTLLTDEGPRGTKANGYRDAGESAKKIGDTIADKAAKYAKLNAPFILFVMFGEYSIGLHELETALYGSTVDEISIDGLSTDECHPSWHKCGILCPPTSDASCKSLSAVVSCEWFDTLNSSARGRRLRLVAYHHWQPTFALPLGACGPFCDLSWRLDGSTRILRPEVTGDSSLVMNTTSEDPPTFKHYSTDNPW